MKQSACSLLLFSLALLSFAGSQVMAEIRLPALFSDHLVMQQDKTIPVWGWAAAGEKVAISIDGQTQSTTADAKGRWRVKLAPIQAAQPLEMTVQGTNKITIKDVLIGETWLCAGQSNMVMTVAQSKDFERERLTAMPQIRMFTVESGRAEKAQEDCVGSWVVCTPETVGEFSAVGFYFARELQQMLGRPVGIINASAGGTLIESWLNSEAQQQCAALKPFFTQRERLMAEFDHAAAETRYAEAMLKWKKAVEDAKSAGQPLPRLPSHPIGSFQGAMNVGGLFNGKIAPLIPFAVRGIAWYQGESNASPERVPFYETQMRLLVTDWRARWGEQLLPFAWVQLPNLAKSMPWAELREAQLKCLDLPKTGMVITVDAGEAHDIHPKDKQTVGHRLAQWALGSVYGRKVAAVSGPLPAGHEVRGSEIVLRFHHADGSLAAKGGPLKGFLIAGENQAWKEGVARIEGDTVIVSSPKVPRPVAVRYAWASDPACNLYNGAGLPASPFRTDSW